MNVVERKEPHPCQYGKYKGSCILILGKITFYFTYTLRKSLFSYKKAMGSLDKLVYMTLRNGLLIEKANIDWCDECISTT
jgi:hypothetical protein